MNPTQGRLLGGEAFVKTFTNEAVKTRDRAVEVLGGIFATMGRVFPRVKGGRKSKSPEP